MSKKEMEVATKQNTAVALAGQFEEDAGSGFENADSTAYAIPFLSILQSMSPQCKKSDGAYIKGAEEGMLYNSVSQEIFDGSAGVTVIPCYFKRTFIKWAPRDSGGGFKGELMPSDPQVAAATINHEGKLIDGEGNLLSDTRTHYVLVVTPDGNYQQMALSLASSQIKTSRSWMSRMAAIKTKRSDGTYYQAPMFSHEYRIRTAVESNAKGSWFGLKVETLGAVASAELYQAAKAFRDAVSSGEVKEAMPRGEVDLTGSNADEDGSF